MAAPLLVSVLVPTYNRAAFLRECLDSALSQDFDGFEVLISDDASDDGETWELCREYGARDRRVRVLRNPSNLAQAGNLRRCLAEARAPIAKFLFSDDVLYPGALEGLVRPLLNDASLVLVSSRWDIIDGGGTPQPAGEAYDLGLREDTVLGADHLGNAMLTSLRNYPGTPSAVAFRRDRLDPAHVDRMADEVFRLVVDVVMWLHLLREGPLLYRGAHCLSAYRVHDANYGADQLEVALELWRLQRASRSLGYLTVPEQQRQATAEFLRWAAEVARHQGGETTEVDEPTGWDRLSRLTRAVAEAADVLRGLG
jgi:glycosyltransferase involved in cell wall biosynthesis